MLDAIYSQKDRSKDAMSNECVTDRCSFFDAGDFSVAMHLMYPMIEDGSSPAQPSKVPQDFAEIGTLSSPKSGVPDSNTKASKVYGDFGGVSADLPSLKV